MTQQQVANIANFQQRKASIAEIKAAARGRWSSILQDAGLPSDCLGRFGRPCPKCGGEDRYNADQNVDESGAVFCRHCFTKASDVSPGDGIATVAWLQGSTYGKAAGWLADRLGLVGQTPIKLDIITETALNKRMPVDAFKAFGVKEAKRGRDKRTVCRVDLYNEAGEVHSYFDLWPNAKGKVKQRSPDCDNPSGLFFPGRLPQEGETWIAVEGVKDAAALTGLGFNAFGYCGSRLNPKYGRLFAGVDVVVVPDLDLAGLMGVEHTAASLFGIASSVAVSRLPGSVKDSGGDDVRDVLKRPDGEALVRKAIDDAEPWKPNPDLDDHDDRPDVLVSMNEAMVTDRVVSHLGELGWKTKWIPRKFHEAVRVFVRGGSLVHAIESDDVDAEGRLTIRELPPCLIRERITQACNLVIEKETEGEVVVRRVRPPGWLIDSIAKRGAYNGRMRPLSGVVESPTIRVDGSVVQSPGYDRQTGLIYRPSIDFPTVPDSPSRSDASKALSVLMDVLTDFPIFEDADRTAWVSMVLSMIGRPCIAGYVPLFAVTANIRGAGKSLLVDAATLIAYGRRASRKAFTRDDDEMRKTITAVAIGAVPSVLFDNLDMQLGGASLDAAITSSSWSDRILGQSRMTDLPLRTIWSATGNNMAFGTDIGRRVLPIRLQSPLETPETRTGFKHPDLLAWVGDERPRLAVAALTILRAYFVAGCPVQPNGEWGSFESWSAIIRGAIVWAGGADPLPTRATALAGDDTAALLEKLIVGIEQADPTGIGLTVKEIQIKTYGSEADIKDNEVLAEAVFEICGERFNAHKLGRRIRGMKGRVHGGKFIDNESAGGGVKRWRVRLAESGFGGLRGSVAPQPGADPSLSPDEANTKPSFGGGPERNHSNPPNPPRGSSDDGVVDL
ncbi:primase-helicase zinc-binding domain-containing protein [Rhodopirellula baltica]